MAGRIVTLALVTPASIPIDWKISFSTLWQGEQCARQVAYDRMKTLRRILGRPNLMGALGVVAHQVLGASRSGKVSADEFEHLWTSALEYAGRRMQSTSIGPIPDHESWPGYWVAYERLRARLVNESLVGLSKDGIGEGVQHHHGNPALPLVECKLDDDIRLITGTPDRVYSSSANEICIRDYKTGAGVNAEKESAQLHLYAHLVSVATGLNSDWGEIDRLRGTPERIQINLKSVMQVVDRATQMRSVITRQESVAKDPDICSSCVYRLVCPDDLTKGTLGERDLLGVVERIILSPTGAVSSLVLRSPAGEVVLGGLEPRDFKVDAGEKVLAVGLRRSHSDVGLLAEWSTTVVTESALRTAVVGGSSSEETQPI